MVSLNPISKYEFFRRIFQNRRRLLFNTSFNPLFDEYEQFLYLLQIVHLASAPYVTCWFSNWEPQIKLCLWRIGIIWVYLLLWHYPAKPKYLSRKIFLINIIKQVSLGSHFHMWHFALVYRCVPIWSFHC